MGGEERFEDDAAGSARHEHLADADWDDLLDDEDGDTGAPLLLPPEDRLWRHPSELAHLSLAGGAALAPAAASLVRPAHAAPARAGAWALALLSAVVGATVVTGVLAATVGVGRGPSLTWVSRTEPDEATATATTVTSRPLLPIRTVADDVRPSIAKLELSTGSTSWNALALGLGAGVVLTGAASLDGATRIRVLSESGTLVPASVLGTDERTGIAVLQLASGDVPRAPMGSALSLTTGTPVVVLASDAKDGLRPEASVATIVGVGESHDVAGTELRDLLRVDEAPDTTTGAAVIDRRGGVVGLALPSGRDAVVDPETSVVPIDVALAVAEDIVNGREPSTGSLGVTLTDLTAADAAANAVDSGAVVQSVSGAFGVDLLPGDVIVGLDGETVPNAAWLSLAVRRSDPGRVVTLTTLRAGERSVFLVSLGRG